MEIHVHIHDGEVREGRTPKRRSSPKTGKKSPRASTGNRKKGKPMTRKTQLAINRGRKAKGLKPIKWKKKGA